MTLNDTQIRNAKPRARPYKLADSHGLTLIVNPDSSKWWRYRYRFGGTEKMLSLGIYDAVSLKDARDRRDDARKLIARNIDPSDERKRQKQQTANTVAAVADEYLEKQADKLAASTLRKAKWMVNEFVRPTLGSKPIATLKASDVLTMLRKIEAKGHLETTRKVKELCGRICRYAVSTDRAERDPTADLRGALKPPVVKSHAAITEPKKVGELLRAIEGYEGQPSTTIALKIAPHVFLRPGELRQAQWVEIDLDAALWRIPAHRTKMRREHLVPLSDQVVALLRQLHVLTGSGEFVFPAIGAAGRPISDNTINAALRRIGYTNDMMVAHGFRAMASTLLNELSFPPDVIELQLAHKDKDAVRAIYNRATRIAERKKMMQSWSDHLDGLRAGGNVVAIKRSA